MAQNIQQKADENGMCFHSGGTHIESVPLCMLLPNLKSPQARTGPNGGPPEKPPNHFLPRQPASWPQCLGRL